LSIVLGYHGCTKQAAQLLLSGSCFELSNKPYDWLGAGSYFWEDDVVRAYQWACERRSTAPCVVGAVIELGNCLDLTKQTGILAVKAAYESYVKMQRTADQPIPVNKPAPSGSQLDMGLRYLDRAVIDHLHQVYASASERSGGKTREFDTVRAMFPEGRPLYDEAGFREKTHVQIAIRDPKQEQILGVFRVPSHQLKQLSLPDIYGF